MKIYVEFEALTSCQTRKGFSRCPHEVTNVGHDRQQLANMAGHVQAVTGKKEITVIADRGYFSGVEILACEEQGAVPLVPKAITSINRALGLFDRRDFYLSCTKR
jgi:hypothetical protein